jgi:hypothetical protein
MADTSMFSDSGPVLSVVVFGYRNEATILRAVRSVMDPATIISDDRRYVGRRWVR